MTQLTAAQELSQEIAQLQEALVSSNPGMHNMLRKIHTELRKDASLVTTLSEEEIATVVQSLMRQTNTVIATAAAKPSRAKTASLKATTLDDL